jgi:hypothetical protein
MKTTRTVRVQIKDSRSGVAALLQPDQKFPLGFLPIPFTGTGVYTFEVTEVPNDVSDETLLRLFNLITHNLDGKKYSYRYIEIGGHNFFDEFFTKDFLTNFIHESNLTS